MQILVIGTGSIGSRHISNLLDLGYAGISVVSRNPDPDRWNDLTWFSSVNEAIEAGTFDLAFVCNPTSMHLQTSIELLQGGVTGIFIEKPLSNDFKDVEDLQSLVSEKGTAIHMGFDLRFDPGLIKVKELLDSGVVGRATNFRSWVGQFLPDWRPGTDHKSGSSARKDLGGGVLLDLIHEVDYIRWLLGDIGSLGCFHNNIGELGIETEDTASILIRTANGATGTINLDYLRRKLSRGCEITGSKGYIHWDYSDQNVCWFAEGMKEESRFDYSGYERNDRFREEISAVIGDQDHPSLSGLEDGIESLKIVLAAKKSAKDFSMIDFSNFRPE